MIVYPAIEAAVTKPSDYVPTGNPRLWGSDMCHCPRKAMLRVQGNELTVDFTTEAKIRMRGGIVWEDETIGALTEAYGEDVGTQFALANDTWSCRVDAILYHGTRHPILIEHKAVGDKWWNYDGNLVQDAHVGQLWLYGELYTELYGIRPTLILFYRAWSNWAELTIDPVTYEYSGQMNGKPYAGQMETDYRAVRATLELYYRENALAPVLADKDRGCTFRGKPSCSMYYHCYPQD